MKPRLAPAGTAAQVLCGAARAVAATLGEGQSLERALSGAPAGAQHAAIRAVATGTVRWYLRLAPAVLPMLARMGAQTDVRLRALLVAAVHQIEYSQHPPATTVAAAVDAARMLHLERAAGLVNAVLRRYLRECSARLARIDADPAARTAHPDWLVAALKAAWPDRWAGILDADNRHPPLCLRLAAGASAVPAYLHELAAQGIEGAAVPGADAAVTLASPLAVERLPGFAEGRVSVQDSSAQLAALLLAPRPGERILDACAAPGGKTGALLEAAGGPIDLTALDSDAVRLQRVAGNLQRLRREATLVHADLRSTDWWQGRPFDAILLDAACSGTGVIRRHPDIKLLRRATDIAALAALQLDLLRACWPLLRPGGRLLYATCSVLPDENGAVVRRFLALEPGAALRASPEAGARCPPLGAIDPGWQILPESGAGGDGFYYACLEKSS